MNRLIDYSEHFPNAIVAQGKGCNVLILRRLKEPVRRFDRKMAQYSLEYRWLTDECRDEKDESYVCVEGNEYSYWQRKEILPLLRAIEHRRDVDLFAHFNLFV